MKKCSRCKQYKEFVNFNKKSSTLDGYQPQCRLCQRQWYKNYYQTNPKEKNRLNKNNKKIADLNRSIIRDAKSVPCMDCGMSYPYYVMDFDHRDPALKVLEVGRLITQSTAKLIKEIAKCDVVCSNCHRIRTYGILEA